MFSLEWTTPTRRSQDRILDPLPVELYALILNHFAPRTFDYPVERSEHQDLVRIALVCRYFCATALPWIFHTLCWPYNGNAMTTLCQGLVQKVPAAEAMALLVRKARLLHKPVNTSPTADAFIRLHLNGLLRMKELRTLTLAYILPNKRVCRILEELSNLTTLELLYCISDEYNGAKELIALSPTLKVLRMVGTRWPGLVDSVDLHVLRELVTKNGDLLRRIQSVDMLPQMESLVWYGPSELMTPSLLDQMPNLKKLCYNYDWRESWTASESWDFGRVVPLLEEACLPLDVLGRFNLCQRRLTRLSIAKARHRTPPSSAYQVETIGICSAGMISLRIPHGCYTAWNCATDFPKLQSLEITNAVVPTVDGSGFGGALFSPSLLDEFLVSVLPLWAGHPTLRRFVIWANDHHLFHYDLPAQYDVLIRLVIPKFPKIEEFRMTDGISWIREPATVEWFPDFRRPISDDLGSALQQGRCRDYRDAFANLLSSRPLVCSNYVGPSISWHFDNFSWIPYF